MIININFRHWIGKTVEHKLGWPMIVIMQAVRITTEGTQNNWYLCRYEAERADWFSEEEIKFF